MDREQRQVRREEIFRQIEKLADELEDLWIIDIDEETRDEPSIPWEQVKQELGLGIVAAEQDIQPENPMEALADAWVDRDHELAKHNPLVYHLELLRDLGLC